jgi:hypothetical protein
MPGKPSKKSPVSQGNLSEKELHASIEFVETNGLLIRENADDATYS